MKQLLSIIIVIGMVVNLYAIEFDKPVYEKSSSLFDKAKSLFSFEKLPKHAPIIIKKEDWDNSLVKTSNNEISIVSKEYRIAGRKILLLPNKSYFIFAETIKDNGASRGTLIAKFTKQNKIKWIKHYTANDLAISTKFFIDNNGLLISGNYITGKALASPFIFRVDFNGNIKWAKDYNEELMANSFHSIIKINDGYMAVGTTLKGYTKVEYKDNALYTEGTQNLNASPWIIKLNLNGEKVWEKTIETRDNSHGVEIEKISKNYLVRTIPTTNPQEIIISSNGKIISKKSIKKLSAHLENQYGFATPTIMYQSIIVKRVKEKDFVISKLKDDGTPIWKYTIGITDKHGDKIKIIETSDRGCLIENFQYSFLKGSTHLIKLNSMGIEQWKKSYEGNQGRFIFNDYIKIGQDKYLFLATKNIVLDSKLKNESNKIGFNIALQSGATLIELDLNSNKNEETNSLP